MVDDTFAIHNELHLEEEKKRDQENSQFLKENVFSSQRRGTKLAQNEQNMLIHKGENSEENSSNKFPPISKQSANFN